MRLAGGFYFLTAFLVIRATAQSAFLDQVLGALSAPSPAESRAAGLRKTWLGLGALLTGAAGLSGAVGWSAAGLLFLAACLGQWTWLLVVAPRFVDPFDAPSPSGRRATRNAALGHTALTIATITASPHFPSWPAMDLMAKIFLCAGGIALCAYGLKTQLGARLSLGRPRPDGLASSEEEDSPLVIALRPGWAPDEGGLWDDATAQPLPVSWIEAHTPVGVPAQLAQWNALFQSLADAEDPERRAFLVPDAAERLRATGLPILETLQDHFGEDRIVFDIHPPSRRIIECPDSLILAAEAGCPPLHRAGPTEPCIHPDDFGLSVRLARDLMGWLEAYEERLGGDGDPLWTQEEARAHHAWGESLAGRLSEELRRTGRGHVRVSVRDPHLR